MVESRKDDDDDDCEDAANIELIGFTISLANYAYKPYSSVHSSAKTHIPEEQRTNKTQNHPEWTDQDT